ncbi:hypothetical protein EVC45_31630 [Paraburkholderia sp. UYCP14C]|uniref:hypothetical protein n=1 Tax=Paraburkholderia sp. UYCP14C TaxID=2511130 RepID=UPI001020CF76|nr:hypothetical protein [Paraburkholderia sp. UYCP14C]RZF25826.1 hypothetical protein EVC45_31630 [Paraburkholderia sp. UYCP14C]
MTTEGMSKKQTASDSVGGAHVNAADQRKSGGFFRFRPRTDDGIRCHVLEMPRARAAPVGKMIQKLV